MDQMTGLWERRIEKTASEMMQEADKYEELSSLLGQGLLSEEGYLPFPCSTWLAPAAPTWTADKHAAPFFAVPHEASSLGPLKTPRRLLQVGGCGASAFTNLSAVVGSAKSLTDQLPEGESRGGE